MPSRVKARSTTGCTASRRGEVELDLHVRRHGVKLVTFGKRFGFHYYCAGLPAMADDSPGRLGPRRSISAALWAVLQPKRLMGQSLLSLLIDASVPMLSMQQLLAQEINCSEPPRSPGSLGIPEGDSPVHRENRLSLLHG
jgi:hypothetical protein